MYAFNSVSVTVDVLYKIFILFILYMILKSLYRFIRYGFPWIYYMIKIYHHAKHNVDVDKRKECIDYASNQVDLKNSNISFKNLASVFRELYYEMLKRYPRSTK